MLQFISFASGSSGNCYYLLCDGYGIVIDLGIGIRTFRKHFSDYGLSISQIKAILVTHDHTDHVKAVGAVAQTFKIPVYTSAKVHASMLVNHFVSKKVPQELRRTVEKGTPFRLGPFEITPFHVPHDSADNNGYLIACEDISFVIMTDIGNFTEEMEQVASRATHLVVEANYDETMLATGRYPARLQKRIRGPYGHSENGDTARFLAARLNPSLIRRVWLCHLSAENNLPAKAYEAVSQALTGAGMRIVAQETTAGSLFGSGQPQGIVLQVLPRQTPILLTALE